MKKQILSIFTILAIIVTLVGCKKGTEANTSDAKPATVSESTTEKYIANISESKIEWTGYKPAGSHNGTINLESGVFKLDNNKLQSGSFLIDMNSISCLDLEGDEKAGLESHLKGTVPGKEGHFFNVKSFPTGAFEITGFKSENGKNMLSGNLTLKGVKNNITFPVDVKTEGDTISITSEAFTIDRTKWSVNYGSKSIFDNLGDKFINDDIEIKISIKAKKA